MNNAKFRIWQPPKVGGFEIILVDFSLGILPCFRSRDVGDPRCFLRRHVGSDLFGDGDARFKWSRPLSSQISSRGHLMEAALKEFVACGLVYALSSVSGLTSVAFTGHALPTKTTVDHFTIVLCWEAGRDVWISRHPAVSGCQSFWDPTFSSIIAVSATSIKTASRSGTVISSSIVSKIVTCLQQALVSRGLIFTISDVGAKSGCSCSDDCADSAAPLCSNSQGWRFLVHEEASFLTVCTIQVGTV